MEMPVIVIEGAQMYARDQIREPASVRNATRNYLLDQDSVSSFLRDSTVPAIGSTVSKSELYESYVAYCGDEAMNEVTKGDFGKILIRMNYMDTRGANERKWKGLRLRFAYESSDVVFARMASKRVKLAG